MKIRQIVATMFSMLEDNLKENGIPYTKDETGRITNIFVKTELYDEVEGPYYTSLIPKCISGEIIYHTEDNMEIDPGFEFHITSEIFGPVGKKMMTFKEN